MSDLRDRLTLDLIRKAGLDARQVERLPMETYLDRQCEAMRDVLVSALAPLVEPIDKSHLTSIEAGVPCGRCGGPCLYETGLSNEQWNRVIRRGGPEQTGEYLCASCILLAFVLAGESFTAKLSGGDAYGHAIEVRCVGVTEPAGRGYESTTDRNARTSMASCWICRDEPGGNLEERERCPVHGLKAPAVSARAALPGEPEPLHQPTLSRAIEAVRQLLAKDFCGHPLEVAVQALEQLRDDAETRTRDSQ